MTKDYAKRKNTSYTSKSTSRRGIKRNGPNHTKRGTSPLAWICIGTILGLAIAGVCYWKLNQPTLNVSAIPFLQPTTAEPTPKHVPKTAETRFDFYNLLPNMQIEVSDLNEDKATSTPKPHNKKILADNKANVPSETIEARLPTTAKLMPAPSDKLTQLPFIIQVASFRQPDQAESLKARLALNGFESKIQPIKIGANETWYRLYLGPFPDRISAQNTQKKLESEQKMNSLVMKINV